MKANNLASFQVLQRSRVLVCFDSRASKPPSWLAKRDFRFQADMNLPTDPAGSGENGFMVFAKNFPEGAEVTILVFLFPFFILEPTEPSSILGGCLLVGLWACWVVVGGSRRRTWFRRREWMEREAIVERVGGRKILCCLKYSFVGFVRCRWCEFVSVVLIVVGG